MKYEGYDSKEALLTRFAAGKRVLHVGAVGCTLGTPEEKVAAAERSVHALLSSVSSACVGVDIDEAGVAALSEAGVFTNIIAADIASLTVGDLPLDAVDVIVAGDVIEHLSNPGIMLANLHRLGSPHTRLLVTTPNAMGLPNFVRHATGRYVEGDDHVCSFNAFTLRNLLERHGWTVERVLSCHQFGAAHRTGGILFSLGRAMFRTAPRLGGTLFLVAVARG